MKEINAVTWGVKNVFEVSFFYSLYNVSGTFEV